MFILVPVLCGLIGAIIAGGLGFHVQDLQFYLVCLPWWLLAAAISAQLN